MNAVQFVKFLENFIIIEKIILFSIVLLTLLTAVLLFAAYTEFKERMNREK